MSSSDYLPTAALVSLIVVFVARSRSSRVAASARLTWLASGVGIAALAVSGLTVPAVVVDSWLGGVNLNHLLRNVLTLLAFWLVSQGVATQGSRAPRRVSWWPVAATALVMSLAFSAVEPEATSRDFIREHSTEFALWLYASTYMAGLVVISLHIVVALLRGSSAGSWFIIVGAALTAGGSLFELAYLSAEFWSFWPHAVRGSLNQGFTFLFYPGVGLIAAGIATFHLGHKRRLRHVKKVATRLQAELVNVGHKYSGIPIQASKDRGPAMGQLYQLVIAAHDLEAQHSAQLPSALLSILAAAEEVLSNELEESQHHARTRALVPAGRRGVFLARATHEA